MMGMTKFRAGATLLSLSLGAAQAFATNGYVPHGYGTQSKGMAGAGTALSQDSMDAVTNPASMVYLGDRMDIGGSLFSPIRGFTADTGGAVMQAGKHDSNNELFFVPMFGRNWMLGEDVSIGVSLGANGGMNTEYGSAVYSGFGAASAPTGIDMAQVFAGITYARKLGGGHSVGITPILIGQRLASKGLEPFAGISIHPGNVNDKGYDYSWGAALRLGWLGHISDRLSLGAAWQTRGYMTRFDRYRGLLAEQGDFDIPPILNLGLAWRASDAVTVALDYQEIFFGDIASLSNSNDRPFATSNLGGDDGLGFGWQDMSILKFGVQWALDDTWTVRAGYSHADDAFEGSQVLFNVLAPATVTDHVTLGASREMDRNSAIHVSFTHGLNQQTPGGNPNTGAQVITPELSLYELEISWSRRF